jgi:hypothetical protein
MRGEIFAILCQPIKGASVQALEIIRHIDASFDMKKSRWDYQPQPRCIIIASVSWMGEDADAKGTGSNCRQPDRGAPLLPHFPPLTCLAS